MHEILRRRTLGLYRWRPQADEVCRAPLVRVMATTDRAHLFDLALGRGPGLK